jgi:TetR/AcrR family fatty acid metabolism transcriptional regulator
MTPRYKNSTKEEAMQKTRKLLLEAAAEEFAREGYDKANINHIAEAAGFSIGTVYNYFSSKRDLMFAFINEVTKKHIDFMIGQVELEKDPHKRIEAFFNAGYAFVEKNTTQMKAILNALNGPNIEQKEVLFQAYLPLFQLLSEEVVSTGIAYGDFRQVDPNTTARLIMQIYLGTSSQLSPEGKPWIDHAQVADFVLHSLQCGKEQS